MSDASRKTPTSSPTPGATTAPRPSVTPAAAKAETSRPRPAMRSDERLIGRSIIGSGTPTKR